MAEFIVLILWRRKPKPEETKNNPAFITKALGLEPKHLTLRKCLYCLGRFTENRKTQCHRVSCTKTIEQRLAQGPAPALYSAYLVKRLLMLP